jgi:hypothetical protein
MSRQRDRDRRQDDRGPARGMRARMRRGYPLAVIDLSARGALVEGRQPLRPGSYVDVHLESDARRETLAARVVRCAVSAIDAEAGVTYRAALSFTNSCDWVREVVTPNGNALHAPSAEPRSQTAGAGQPLPGDTCGNDAIFTESAK